MSWEPLLRFYKSWTDCFLEFITRKYVEDSNLNLEGKKHKNLDFFLSHYENFILIGFIVCKLNAFKKIIARGGTRNLFVLHLCFGDLLLSYCY